MRKDKVRDIARGVLPSTARKGARDNKRHYHHEHRSAQRQANHRIVRSLTAVDDDGTLYTDPDLFDEFEERFEFDGYSAGSKKEGKGWDDMGEIISARRGADKLGPLIRWAEATEKRLMDGWDTADRYAYFKAILPNTLQGRHALGHVQSALRLYPDEFERRYFGGTLRYTNFNDFHNALDRCLATKHGRNSLRDLVREIVPVAAHMVPTNNGRFVWEQARDEDGDLRFNVEVVPASPEQALPPTVIRTPVMVEVWVPQMVAVTCDDCTFLRNDPLATPGTVKRFESLVWDRPRNGEHPWYLRHRYVSNHFFDNRKIIDHVLTF